MRLLLIDGHYYVYRSFYAIRELTNSRGEPTNAIYGFVKTVRKMIKDLAPDLGAVLWDEGLPKRRTELQPAYKATRTEMPQPMRPQLDFIRKLTPLLGLASIGVEDTEADDLIAAYATAAAARGDEVILATNDKDLFQLVDERCRVYSTNKTDLSAPGDAFALLGPGQVLAKWGVPPQKIGEVLALIGDTADNIPGVGGIGQKTAATLINEHGSLDSVLANLDSVKSERIREKLRAAIPLIEQNREMVRLDTDLALPVPMEEMRIAPRWPELIAALEACEFKGLTADVRKEASACATPPPATPPQEPVISNSNALAPKGTAFQQGELF